MTSFDPRAKVMKSKIYHFFKSMFFTEKMYSSDKQLMEYVTKMFEKRQYFVSNDVY